jgi:hypothetical protein
MKPLSQFMIIILVAICSATPAMADSKYPALRDSVDPDGQPGHQT